jgi:hypothetical protein
VAASAPSPEEGVLVSGESLMVRARCFAGVERRGERLVWVVPVLWLECSLLERGHFQVANKFGE